MRSKMLTVILVTAAILVNAPAYAEPPGELVDRVVAVVGGEVITLSELEEAAAASPEAPRDKLLEQLIEEKLIEMKAREQGVSVSDSEVEAAMERHIAQMDVSKENFEQMIAQKGISVEEYRNRIRTELMKVKFVKGNVQGEIEISEEEMLNFYRRHPEEFKSTQEVRLARIFLPFTETASAQKREKVVERARNIKSRVQAGESFEKLAREYSKGSNASEGGSLGWVNPDYLRPDFKNAVSNLPPGGVSEVIILDNGCHLLYAKDKREARVKPFEEVRGRIQQQLYSRKIGEELDKLVGEMKQQVPIERKL